MWWPHQDAFSPWFVQSVEGGTCQGLARSRPVSGVSGSPTWSQRLSEPSQASDNQNQEEFWRPQKVGKWWRLCCIYGQSGKLCILLQAMFYSYFESDCLGRWKLVGNQCSWAVRRWMDLPTSLTWTSVQSVCTALKLPKYLFSCVDRILGMTILSKKITNKQKCE